MSGLYLPNATLPKYGHKIEILFDGSVAYVDYVHPYREMDPVIPLPDHGRLIDADALERALREDAKKLFDQLPYTGTKISWAEAYAHFADITHVEPTIIESEEGEA